MRVSAVRYVRLAQIALAMLCVIVLTGALVRLTGSGLGCVDWPACNEERFIDVSSTHGAIEQINRLFTGVVALAVIVAVGGALFRTPPRRDLTWLSVGLVVGVLGQVVLGGIVVLTGLHPLANMGHFLLSMVLVANGLVLCVRARTVDGAVRSPAEPRVRLMTAALGSMTTVAVVTGTVVTGTGPHAGDEDAPRFGFEIGSVARIHGISVIVALILAVGLSFAVVRSRHASTKVLLGRLEWFIGVAATQGLIGYVQYFSGVPAGLVAVHIVGATAVFLLGVWVVLGAYGFVGGVRTTDEEVLPSSASDTTTSVIPSQPTGATS
jgi:heme a synthase